VKIPDWWTFTILALAAYRLWRLVSEDEILQAPRRKLVRLPTEWEEGHFIPEGYRFGLAKFISCPWCCGAWIAIGLWAVWLWQPEWTTGLSVPLSLSASVGLVEYFSSD
jgi:hypothetical protein